MVVARVAQKVVEGWAVAARGVVLKAGGVKVVVGMVAATAEATAVVAVRCTLNSPSIQRKKCT